MDKADLAHQANVVDFVTNTMLSTHFLINFSVAVHDPIKSQVPIGQFYEAWLKYATPQERKSPFHPGVFLGYLYCGLILTSEHWLSLVPKEEIAKAHAWGMGAAHKRITGAADLQDVVRRLRNALAHGRVRVDIPQPLPEGDPLDSVKIRFHDVSKYAPTNAFDAVLTMNECINLVRAYHQKIYSHVKQQLGEKKSG